MRIFLQRLYIIEVFFFNLFDCALNLFLRKVTCQWKFRLSLPCLHTCKCVYYSQYQDWLTKSVLGICQSWRWLCIWAWSNKILMLFPSWIRKMSIVQFERDALGWLTRVFFCKIYWCRSYNFIDAKSYVTASMDEIWMCI